MFQALMPRLRVLPLALLRYMALRHDGHYYAYALPIRQPSMLPESVTRRREYAPLLPIFIDCCRHAAGA